MITICKRFEFDAAHHLPCHQGKCKNVHGHRYLLDVEIKRKDAPVVEAPDHPESGMVMDFGRLKEIVNKYIIDSSDHQDLNTIFKNPTAELMVLSFAKRLTSFLPKEVDLVSLKLWETPTSYAEWRR